MELVVARPKIWLPAHDEARDWIRWIKRKLNMSAKSDYLEDALIRNLFRDEALPAWPATLYFALFTAAPGEGAGGTEVTGGSYARQGVVRSPTGSSRFSAPVAGTGLTDNLDQINYPQATGNWGVITHSAIIDALTAGNHWYYGALTSSKTVNTGDTFRYNAGDFDISEA